jgi:hypothetical protein
MRKKRKRKMDNGKSGIGTEEIGGVELSWFKWLENEARIDKYSLFLYMNIVI